LLGRRPPRKELGMALDPPGYVQDVFSVIGFPWPDIDEDVFHDLKGSLKELAQAMESLGGELDQVLNILHGSNPSHTLTAVHTYFQAVNRDWLRTIDDVVNDLASGCDAAYDIVRWSNLD